MPLPEAIKAAEQVLTQVGGNPSSLHAAGFQAEQTLEQARRTVAEAAGVKPDEFLFTPGGSASDNLAIRGYAGTKRGGRLITSEYEHPAVTESFKSLEEQFEIVRLRPENGIITPEVLAAALTDDTRLVSIMHVNNEIGSVNPIKELAKLTRRRCPDAVFHTDAVQGFMKEPFDYSCVDMASFAAHKTHALRGIGGLYVRKGIRLRPLIYGGGQEKGLCCGTENTAAAAAWAESVKVLSSGLQQSRNTVGQMNAALRKSLTGMGADIVSPEDASPFILNAVFEGFLSENILHFLSNRDIYVSTGSACSSKKGSAVFKALGMEKYAKSAIRISFSHLNTMQEVSLLEQGLRDATATLIKVK